MLLSARSRRPSFMQHFIVFVLACFVGFQVIWNVSHSLHTPLMAVTNAISGDHHPRRDPADRLGQRGGGDPGGDLGADRTINIVGGFLVTRRMLAMFQKS
jgi:H+-translocating NAD(P) transhydrogenase subunit alpha